MAEQADVVPRDPHDPQSDEPVSARVSRRVLVKGSGAAVAATGLAGVAAMRGAGADQSSHVHAVPAAQDATQPVSANVSLTFFNRHERDTVEALTARIFPGTPDDPGAREAGVVDYIDSALAGPYGWGLQTYRQGPFLVVNEEPSAPAPELTTRRDLYQVVEVPAEEAARYGYQSVLTPQEIYKRGLEAVDAYATARFGGNFVTLSEAAQDTIVGELADGSADGRPPEPAEGTTPVEIPAEAQGLFSDPSAQNFFTTLRTHTMEGLFSDPMYGGNRNMVGWWLMGYPGAQRAYAPEELRDPNWPGREPMSLADLANVHPPQPQ